MIEKSSRLSTSTIVGLIGLLVVVVGALVAMQLSSSSQDNRNRASEIAQQVIEENQQQEEIVPDSLPVESEVGGNSEPTEPTTDEESLKEEETKKEESDTRNPQMCAAGGGTWREFPNSCTDSCTIITNPGDACLDVLTDGCDCGPRSCWNGTSCVVNPSITPTFTPAPTATPTTRPTATPIVGIAPTCEGKRAHTYDPNDPNGDGTLIPPGSNIAPGQTFVYWITLLVPEDSNGDVIITDVLPSTVRYVGVHPNTNPDNARVTVSGQTVTANMGRLVGQPLVAYRLGIIVRAAQILAEPPLVNTAEVTVAGSTSKASSCSVEHVISGTSTTPTPSPTASPTATPGQGTISCREKRVYIDNPRNQPGNYVLADEITPEMRVTVGQVVVFVLYPQVTGQPTFSQYSISDALPAYYEFMDADDPCTYNDAARTVSCLLGRGQTTPKAFRVRIVSQPFTGSISNTATFSNPGVDEEFSCSVSRLFLDAPVAPVCREITRDTAAPVVGSQVRFTCTPNQTADQGETLTYEFRTYLNGVELTTNINPVGSSNISLPLSIASSGRYEVQCRVCSQVRTNRTTCEDWATPQASRVSND